MLFSLVVCVMNLYISPERKAGISILPAYPEGFSGSGSGSGFEPLPANCLSVNSAFSFPAMIVIMTLRSAPVFAFIYPLIEPFPLPDVLLNVHQVSLLEACHVPSAFTRMINPPPLALICVWSIEAIP